MVKENVIQKIFIHAELLSFFFIINFTLKTCMYFASGDATMFPVPITWEANERWKRCCECMGGDANIGKNVSAFRWMSKLWGLRENSLKFYCGSLLLTCLYVTAKCKCKRQHVRSIFNGLDSVGARVYFHFCQHFDALAHDLQKKKPTHRGRMLIGIDSLAESVKCFC